MKKVYCITNLTPFQKGNYYNVDSVKSLKKMIL